jgi:hypothetical protein
VLTLSPKHVNVPDEFFAVTVNITFFTESGGFDTLYAHASSLDDTARVPHFSPEPRTPVTFQAHGAEAAAGPAPTIAMNTTASAKRRSSIRWTWSGPRPRRLVILLRLLI